jgi:beta-glucosidase
VALKSYHWMVQACRERGLEPVVTLWHFVSPRWVHDVSHPDAGLGGWAGRPQEKAGEAAIIDAFARFAGRIAAEFKGEVKYWIPINEPAVHAFETHVMGNHPGSGPGHYEEAWRALINMAYGQAAACATIHRADPNAQVGVSQHIRVMRPLVPTERSRDAADQLHYLGNQAFLDAVMTGQVDWNTHGKSTHDPRLVSEVDWIGIQYYTSEPVLGLPPAWIRSLLGVPKEQGSERELRGVPVQSVLEDALARHSGALRERTEMGWSIRPDDLYNVLRWAAERYPVPLMVSECGAADSVQPSRIQAPYLAQQVLSAQDAARDGAFLLLGFLPWSWVHNNEWGTGVKHFGLFERNEDGLIVPNAGGAAFADIALHRGVTPELWKKTMTPLPGDGFLEAWRAGARWRRSAD